MNNKANSCQLQFRANYIIIALGIVIILVVSKAMKGVPKEKNYLSFSRVCTGIWLSNQEDVGDYLYDNDGLEEQLQQGQG